MKASEISKGAWCNIPNIWKSFTKEQLKQIIGEIKYFTSDKGFIYAKALLDHIDKMVGELPNDDK